jgi:hypothetical protein
MDVLVDARLTGVKLQPIACADKVVADDLDAVVATCSQTS